MFSIRRNSLIILGVAVVVVLLVIGVTAVTLTNNSTQNNTTNNTTVNLTDNNTTVNATNNTTSNSTNTTSTKSSSKNSKASESSGDSGYRYSAQYGEYIKEWRDSDGNYHVRGRDSGLKEDYNTHTGEYKSYSKDYGYEHYYTNPGG